MISPIPSFAAWNRRATTRRRRLGRTAAMIGVSAGVSAALVAAPLATPAVATVRSAVAVPTMPSGLPADIEDLAPYVGQVSCDPVAKPGTLALARLLTATYPGTGYLVERACGSESIASEHADGRALDWTVSVRNATQKAQAEAFLSWLLATDSAGRPFAAARRLGVMYVIWNNRIWSSHDPLGGWRPYSTCQSHSGSSADAVCHRTRLHVSLSWAGAMARTSFWTKSVASHDYGPCRPKDLNWAPPYATRNATPCPAHPTVTAPSGASALAVTLAKYSGATVGRGSTGPVVAAVQQAVGATADGAYGPFTADAVASFQTRQRLTPSGSMDAGTWRALLIATGARAVQQNVVLPTPANPLTKYKNTILRQGSRGAAVTALQKRLKITADGMFGPKTRAAVIAFQKQKKLKATGVVEAATWRALGA